MGPRSIAPGPVPLSIYIERVLVKKASELPEGVIFHEDINLLVWKPAGIVTEPIVNTIVDFLDCHEAAHPRPFNRFTDVSAEEVMELNPEYVFRVALHRRMMFGDRPPAKSAFYVTKPKVAQLIRIHAIVTGGSPLEVAMFEDYQAAATWLGIPLDRLQTGA